MVAGYSGTGDAGVKSKNLVSVGVSFMAGSILSMAIIGGIFGFAGGMISASFANYWEIAAGLLCIFFGLYSMDFLPFKIPSLKVRTLKHEKGIFSSIIFGLTVGGIAAVLNTCCNPIFPLILATSFVKGSTLWGILMLSVFALGYTLPLLAVLVGFRLSLTKLSGTTKVIQYTGGILLILVGFYFLVSV
jgi:cytochrome c-type biogenesis protein